jgi:asparagine synthase (glutamine-hydrolysing)
MARHLGTEHHVVRATHEDIGRVFPDVVWHAETPLMRTAPAPMFLLSKLARDTGFKVVLTGEGADEILAGYDIFKEAALRRFWARQPQSRTRPLLLQRLYPDIRGLSRPNADFIAAFFGAGLADTQSPWYSHAIRWRNNRRTLRFFHNEFLPAAGSGPPPVDLPDEFASWPPLCQAQFIETTTFLSQYLLSSQGDRMGMAHSIEGRFPFLDVRLVEFCNSLPPRLKLRGLREKHLLKEAARPWLPERITLRPKRPYRAPVHRSFFNNTTPEYVRELLSAGSIRSEGIFNPDAVEHLVRKVRDGAPLGETDDMALVGILSTQLVQHQFVRHYQPPRLPQTADHAKVRRIESKTGTPPR